MIVLVVVATEQSAATVIAVNKPSTTVIAAVTETEENTEVPEQMQLTEELPKKWEEE